jgi:hypothetical protein
VQIIAVDGVTTDPAADPDSTGEVMLDIDVLVRWREAQR